MIFDSINLLEELVKERKNEIESAENLLNEAYSILKESARNSKERNFLSQLDQNRIFSITQIKSICINYRLRFLDLDRFKGELPEKAINELNFLKENLGTNIGKLKIIAPSHLFKLDEKDSDPLLFMSLGNDNYYLIHQWGSDMKWYRKIQAFAFRSLLHFIGFIVLAAFLFAQLMPIDALPGVNDQDGIFSVYRLYIFAFTTISFCSLSVLFLFTFRKNFSEQEWTNRYLS